MTWWIKEVKKALPQRNLSFAASVFLRVAQAQVKALPLVANKRGRKFFLWYFLFCIKKKVHPQALVNALYLC